MKEFLRYQRRLWKPALAATLMSSIMMACNSDNFEPDPVDATLTSSKLVSTNRYNENLEVVALALAKSLADETMRTFVKTEAKKKVDGDYNILYSTVENKRVKDQTFVQMLNQSQENKQSARPMPIGELSLELPLLNISVPVGIKFWDVKGFTPWVAVLTDDESKPLKAFDKDGNVHWLDALKAPNFPVVIVGRSERYTLSTTGQVEMKKGLLPFKSGGARLNGEDQLPDDGSGGGGYDNPGSENPNPPTSNDCSDMSKTNITLTGWYSGNLSAIESWARGAPEIRMRAFATTQSGTKVDVYGDPVRGNLWEPGSRDQVNGRWWNLNDYLFNWNINYYGEEVTFILHEEDGGSPRDISIPVSYKLGGFNASTTITFRVDDGDDYVGYFPRQLPFCSGSTIGNETLKFKVNRN